MGTVIIRWGKKIKMVAFEIIINIVFGIVFEIRIFGVGVLVVVNREGTTLSGRTLSGVRVLDTAVSTIIV